MEQCGVPAGLVPCPRLAQPAHWMARMVEETRGYGFSPAKDPDEPLSRADYAPFIKEDHAATLRVHQKIQDSMKLPLHEQGEFIRSLEASEYRKETPMTNMLMGRDLLSPF